MRARDNQKERLYRSERESLHGWGPQNMSIPECQAYVDKVLASHFVQTRWGQVRVEVQATHGGGRSFGGHIRLGTWARQTPVILHELAHELSARRSDIAHHGPEFAACFVLLVDRFMGKDQGAKLRAAYKEHHVRYRAGMAYLPKPGMRRVVTQKARQEAARSKVAMPLSAYEEKQAADMIRRAVATGMFGEVGRKPRAHAQAVARALEKSYADRAPST